MIKAMEDNSTKQYRALVGDFLFVLGLSTFALLIPCFIIWKHLMGELSAELEWQSLSSIVGLVLAAFAAFLVFFNLYTSFLRAWLHKRKHGNYDNFQNVSGAPALGSILIFVAALFLPACMPVGIILLVLYLLDMGGIHVAALMFFSDLLPSDK